LVLLNKVALTIEVGGQSPPYRPWLRHCWEHLDHRCRLYRGSGKNSPLPAAQSGQKRRFAPASNNIWNQLLVNIQCWHFLCTEIVKIAATRNVLAANISPNCVGGQGSMYLLIYYTINLLTYLITYLPTYPLSAFSLDFQPLGLSPPPRNSNLWPRLWFSV